MLQPIRPWLARSGLKFTAPHSVPVTEVRSLTTLAIESSCDDTSVAVLEKVHSEKASPSYPGSFYIHFHEKITANNQGYGGIHPIVSLDSHQSNLAKLVNRALYHLPQSKGQDSDHGLGKGRTETLALRKNCREVSMARTPDFISVTRGPGMRSNLSVGLNFAKGLSVAWQRPLVGVHHMQAHALTPRLVSALRGNKQDGIKPDFPFLSLLVSGGHTLLLHSHSLTSHTTLASTTDIAIGDAIDKVARVVIPTNLIGESKSTMFGPIMERFAFPNGSRDYGSYEAPRTRDQEIKRQTTKWGWGFTPPFGATKGGSQNNRLEYSFSGIPSTAIRAMEQTKADISVEERMDMAREAMRVAFEHLASKMIMGLNQIKEKSPEEAPEIKTLVVSGGVAANGFLKKVLRSCLDVRGYKHIELVFPPVELCTDNAAMIAWAGMEMFEAGYQTDLECHPLRKWSMDPNAEGGGILGIGGWTERAHGRSFDQKI